MNESDAAPAPPRRWRAFDVLAEDYANARPLYPAALAERLLSATGGAGDLALDLGCGPGSLALVLARIFPRVVAIDLSPPMLGALRRRARSASTSRLQPVRADVGRLPIRFHAASCVVCSQSLHWFDPAPFFAEVERTLRPGGVFAVCRQDPMDYESAPERLYQEGLRAVLGEPAAWPRGPRSMSEIQDRLALSWSESVHEEWDLESELDPPSLASLFSSRIATSGASAALRAELRRCWTQGAQRRFGGSVRYVHRVRLDHWRRPPDDGTGLLPRSHER